MVTCRNCRRQIEWVDGVGWLHPDPRVYWVRMIEPKCDAALPVEENADGHPRRG